MSGSRKSINLLSGSGKEYEVVGKAVRADSYYGYTDGYHTIQVKLHNFTGGFGIQGTLSLEPEENDWFWVNLTAIDDFDSIPYITYPRDPQAPTGNEGTINGIIGDSGTEGYTFRGNFTFLRAVVTRKHIDPYPEQPSDGTWMYGEVDNVIVCL